MFGKKLHYFLVRKSHSYWLVIVESNSMVLVSLDYCLSYEENPDRH